MIENFAVTLLDWFDRHGRKDLPWQKNADPYRIWLSEVMLQQTQVKTVIPYFEKFCERFPCVDALANAPEDEVLHLWSGLGYYARARNLHHAAKQIATEFENSFPEEQQDLESLKGVGRSTAAAIRAQAYGEKAAILDGNVKRVLARLFAIEEWPGQSTIEKRMWELSESLLPDARLRDFTQAIMDLGATLCTRSSPACDQCPFQNQCLAHEQNRVDELPTRKPKKQNPVRETTFLIVRNGLQEVLLEKRPAVGIWGGLWSFPEASDEELAGKLNQFSVSASSTKKLEMGEHVFSHFRLKYKPVLIDIGTEEMNTVYEPEKFIWYSTTQPQELGLAAPVAKLIKQLEATD